MPWYVDPRHSRPMEIMQSTGPIAKEQEFEARILL
jgi:hypothetical protein